MLVASGLHMTALAVLALVSACQDDSAWDNRSGKTCTDYGANGWCVNNGFAAGKVHAATAATCAVRRTARWPTSCVPSAALCARRNGRAANSSTGPNDTAASASRQRGPSPPHRHRLLRLQLSCPWQCPTSPGHSLRPLHLHRWPAISPTRCSSVCRPARPSDASKTPPTDSSITCGCHARAALSCAR